MQSMQVQGRIEQSGARIKRVALITVAVTAAVVGSVAAVTLSDSNSPSTPLQATVASSERDLGNQNPRQNPLAAELSSSTPSATATDVAFNQNPRQNVVLAQWTAIQPVAVDAFNQNPRQNPALTTGSVEPPSEKSVDTLNQNPRQNPLAATTTSTVAQSEEPEVFNQNPRHA